MIRICGAAAGAIEPCPAVAALLARINIAGGEFIAHGGVCNARPNVSEQEFIIPDKLMAGYRSPHGVTAMYSVPEPQPDMRLYMHGPPARSII